MHALCDVSNNYACIYLHITHVHGVYVEQDANPQWTPRMLECMNAVHVDQVCTCAHHTNHDACNI